MSMMPDYFTYNSQDGSTQTHIMSDSETLRSKIRERCNKIVGRLIPNGEGSLGDWNDDDVLELTAVFHLAYVFRHSGTENPLLTRGTILWVLTRLTTGSLFNDHSTSSL